VRQQQAPGHGPHITANTGRAGAGLEIVDHVGVI